MVSRLLTLKNCSAVLAAICYIPLPEPQLSWRLSDLLPGGFRTTRSRLFSFHFALAIAFLCLPAPGNVQEQPNIVLVFMDKFGWAELGFNGGGIARVDFLIPRVDRPNAVRLRLDGRHLCQGLDSDKHQLLLNARYDPRRATL